MAEIQVKGGGKAPPRVDLTAMVDLGLLLITFFMFTTTMAKPKAMQLELPFEDENMTKEQESKIKNDEAITLLLAGDHKIYYYEGMATDPSVKPEVLETTFADNGGLRDVIIQKKKKVEALKVSGVLDADDQATVVIKANFDSTTDDLIKAIDEMTINNIQVFAVTDITEVDISLLQEKKGTTPPSTTN